MVMGAVMWVTRKKFFLGGRLRQSQLDQYTESGVERVEKVPALPYKEMVRSSTS